jgi:hypothetical protein
MAAIGELSVHPMGQPQWVGQGEYTVIPPTYSLFDDHGQLVWPDVPGSVLLPEGRYLVRLEQSSRWPSIFWVRVEAGRRTDVNLDVPFQSGMPGGPSEVPGARE